MIKKIRQNKKSINYILFGILSISCLLNIVIAPKSYPKQSNTNLGKVVAIRTDFVEVITYDKEYRIKTKNWSKDFLKEIRVGDYLAFSLGKTYQDYSEVYDTFLIEERIFTTITTQ